MLGRIFTAIVLAVLVAPAATAQNLQEGLAAYNRGDYAAALRGLRPLALKRDAKAQYKLAFMYLSSPLKKSPLTGVHATVKHNVAKAVSPSCETMRTI